MRDNFEEECNEETAILESGVKAIFNAFGRNK